MVAVLLLVVVERPLKQEPQLPWDDRSLLRLSEQQLLTQELGERGGSALPKVLTVVALDPETLLLARRVLVLGVLPLVLMLKLQHQAGLVLNHQSLPQ